MCTETNMGGRSCACVLLGRVVERVCKYCKLNIVYFLNEALYLGTPTRVDIFFFFFYFFFCLIQILKLRSKLRIASGTYTHQHVLSVGIIYFISLPINMGCVNYMTLPYVYVHVRILSFLV